MNRKITNRETGEHYYVTLPKPIWSGSERLGTGVTLKAIYYGKRSGRMIIETYSQWVNTEKNDGSCYGTSYTEINESDYIHYCDIAGIDPVGVVAVDIN